MKLSLMKLALMITVTILSMAGIDWLFRHASQDQPRPSRYHEFKLDDGTRCVMTYRGALDCDWRGKK